MTKEKEEYKLRYITKKMTLINERISMHEKMKKIEKSIKIAEIIKKKGTSSECSWKFINNMKPKKEEASAMNMGIKLRIQRNKMVYSYHYKNL